MSHGASQGQVVMEIGPDEKSGRGQTWLCTVLEEI